jgi:hypothetical protein
VVPRRLLGVRRALTDLEVPQASAEGEQEGEDEDLDDDEPDLDPWVPAGLGNVGHCGRLPLSVRVRMCGYEGVSGHACADTSEERRAQEPAFLPERRVRVNFPAVTAA